MQFSYELNDRQSARVLEQAIRTGLTIRMDPHYSSQLEPFGVRLSAADETCLTFRILEDQGMAGAGLTPGLFCQAQFTLPAGVYMLSTYVLDVDENRQWLRAARPQIVQILERRKFFRTQLAEPTPVMLRWPDGRQAQTNLFNICGDGLAFHVARDVAEAIPVGERMVAAFTLPGMNTRFEFPVQICNKTPTSDEQHVIVGVQFQVDQADTQGMEWLAELRRFLVSQQQATPTR